MTLQDVIARLEAEGWHSSGCGCSGIVSAFEEIDRLRGELADEKRWADSLLGQIEARKTKLRAVVEAATALISRADFWEGAGTLPGEYDDLADALKEV